MKILRAAIAAMILHAALTGCEPSLYLPPIQMPAIQPMASGGQVAPVPPQTMPFTGMVPTPTNATAQIPVAPAMGYGMYGGGYGNSYGYSSGIPAGGCTRWSMAIPACQQLALQASGGYAMPVGAMPVGQTSAVVGAMPTTSGKGQLTREELTWAAANCRGNMSALPQAAHDLCQDLLMRAQSTAIRGIAAEVGQR